MRASTRIVLLQLPLGIRAPTQGIFQYNNVLGSPMFAFSRHNYYVQKKLRSTRTPREMVPSCLSRLMMCQLSYVHGPIGGKQPGETTSRSVPRYTRLLDMYHRCPQKDGKEHDAREMYQIGLQIDVRAIDKR